MMLLATTPLAIESLVEATVALCAIGLAGVFLAAAGFKLVDGDTTVDEFAALGLPRPGLLARAVPAVEVVTALLLLFRPRLGSALALALLAAFTVVLARALRQGNRVSCGCFGAVGRAPISAVTLVRNVVLMVMAVMAAGRALLPVPDLAAVIAVSMPALVAMVLAQLVILGRRLGRIWSVELAGESNTTEVVSQ